MAKYLTPEWVDDLDRAAQASDAIRVAAPDLVLVVEHAVTGLAEGTVRYHIEFDHGVARLRFGPAVRADASFTEDHETAVAVSTGAINAQSAFMAGRLRVSGDMDKLMAAQPAFAALDAALGTHAGEDHLCLSCPSCKPTPNASPTAGAATCCASSRRCRSRR